MAAIFKADENEKNKKYFVSARCLEANSDIPGAHFHEENDKVFYVLEGTTSFLVSDNRIDANKGTF
jgi:mannose-6-phosphate isomerase-like protein (cupin superfamily)